ncbi:restriction endonuclease subunit S [Mycoplasma sp. 888]|uniref:restriction endonuclease subunit S n=1 Tax=Mycoplasma sp. 888 TaxID=3108483 RepID=UPI002D7772B7|nr:restriction endonuclease subunit S [Mycoplasma sp. 888]WRQ26103.1 restriction endonuclease subunit S [Mycoplasma sp. 888]
MFDISTGKYIKPDKSLTNGFKIINGGKTPLGYTDNYKFENCITIARVGTAGYVDYINEKFWLSDSCFALKNCNNNLVNDKFAFYYLKNSENELKKLSNGGVLKALNISDLRNLKIKLPPLETQNKIVNILENFETICKDLKIGLPAEEIKRQQQYEFYRNSIFEYLETNSFEKLMREREREKIT